MFNKTTRLSEILLLLFFFLSCSSQEESSGSFTLSGTITANGVTPSLTLTLGVQGSDGNLYKHSDGVFSTGAYTFDNLEKGKTYALLMESGKASCVLTQNIFAQVSSDINNIDIACKSIPPAVICSDSNNNTFYRFQDQGKVALNLSGCKTSSFKYIFTNTGGNTPFVPLTTKTEKKNSTSIISNYINAFTTASQNSDLANSYSLQLPFVLQQAARQKQKFYNTVSETENNKDPTAFARAFEEEFVKKHKIKDNLQPFSLQDRSLSSNATTANTQTQMHYSLQNVGNTGRSWFTDSSTTKGVVSTVLRAQAKLYDGKLLKIWVQDSLWQDTIASNSNQTKINSERLLPLLQKFCGSTTNALQGSTTLEAATCSGDNIYKMVIDIAGQPWGPRRYINLISASQDEIHIVLYKPENSSLFGFFYGANNYQRSSLAYSNEALVFFINGANYVKLSGTETEFKAANAYPSEIYSTLAHEFQHMIHFYQKAIVKDISSPTWLNEMASMVVEDLLAVFTFGKTETGPAFSRLPDHKKNTNCVLSNWYPDSTTGSCNVFNSYATAYSFGGFMARHHGGKEFITKILKSDQNGFAAINEAAGETPADGYKKWLSRWSASLSASTSIATTATEWPNSESGKYLFSQQGSSCSALTDVPCLQKVSSYNETKPSFDLFCETGCTLPVILPQASVRGYAKSPADGNFYINIPPETILTIIRK